MMPPIRWLVRKERQYASNMGYPDIEVQVLQYWHQYLDGDLFDNGEWRDVPIEKKQ